MPYQFNRRQFVVGGASLTVMAALSACGVQSGSSPTSGSAGAVSGAGNGPVNLNPVYAQSLQITSLQTSGKQPVGYPSAYEAAFAIYAGLVRFSRTMTFEPDLATKWSTSKDGLEWTFTLRPGVKFHDGTDFDADAVVSYFTSMLDKSVNLAAYNLWSPIASVTKTDDTTVVVKTTKPYGALLNTMAHGSALIPSPQSVKQFGAEIGLHPVGAGPYQLTKFDPGASLVVKRHDGYYGDKPLYDSVTYLYVGDASGRVSALQTNRAQLIDAVPVEQVDSLGSDSAVKVIDEAALQVFGIGLNFTNTALQDKMVRQAMNYAIDKAALISTIFRGHATVLNSPLAPATTGYVKRGSYDLAIDKATDLLKQAGYTAGGDSVLAKGSTRLSFRLRTPDGMYPNDVQVAQVIQAQLKAVGIEVTIDKVDKAGFWDSIKVPRDKVDFDLVLFGYNPSHASGALALDALYRTNPDAAATVPQWNFNWYSSPAVDAAITAGLQAVDPDKSRIELGRAQQQLWDDCPYIWLYAKNNIAAYSAKVAPPLVLPIAFTLPSRTA